MKNVKKIAPLCVSIIIGAAVLTAEAGTSRSLGGNSMSNGRNFSASHSLGGHTLGGRSTGTTLQNKISNYILSHGGSISKSQDNGQKNLTVNTGKGGTLSSNARLVGTVTSTTETEKYYSTQTTATSANGKTYSGSGQIITDRVSKTLSAPRSAKIDVIHNGTVSGEKQSVKTCGHLRACAEKSSEWLGYV